MPRPDLLALSPDDLAALANRGLLKRAQREAESADLTAQWSEADDGSIVAAWSDDVTTTLPGGKTAKEAQCTCGALELCRHVLRTILAWQKRSSSAGDESKLSKLSCWDPSDITDDAIERQVPKMARDRARVLSAEGVLAELVRSAKPSARFHCPGHTVRFPVPDDIRYAQCSCADPAPCAHAVLAVRAFRLLPAGKQTGIICEGPLDQPVSKEPMVSAQGCAFDLMLEGFSSLTTTWRDRARRAASECADAALTWPAQILEELADDFDHYTDRDAAFIPGPAADRVGELLLRLDAIIAGIAPVPQAFIRGMKSDRGSDLGAARFIGLGASVEETRRSSILTVFLQDCDNGHVVALNREFAEEPGSTNARRSFAQLAAATAVKDASLALLAGGQLVTQGGKRTASGRLVIGRARAVVNPQAFAWEQLKAPVLVEDFAELTARLQLLPPASFRPRRAAGDFHVCPLDAVEHADFDPATNCVVSVVRDRSGQQAVISHPWSDRGRMGAEAFLAELCSSAKPLFVAGHIRPAGAFLHIHPTAIVFAEGTSRRAVMPWIDATPTASASALSRPVSAQGLGSTFRYSAASEISAEIVLNGLRRLATRQWPGFARAITETEERGYHRMTTILSRISQSSPDPAIAADLFKLLALSKSMD